MYPKSVRLYLKTDWQSTVPLDIAGYFAALLLDWKELLRTRPEELLIFTSGLSVGPLRTIETAKTDRERAFTIIHQKLENVLQFPNDVMPIA